MFILITINVINQNTAGFDSYVYQKVAACISDRQTQLMILISYLGSGIFLSALSLVFIVLSLGNKRKLYFAAMAAVNLLLSGLVNAGFKYIIHRDRPHILKLIEVGGLSFPSGHSMTSMSFYGFLIYLCCRNVRPAAKYKIICALWLLVLLIGLSRVYLGVHYASDVLGGFSLGIFWVGLYSLIVDKIYRKNLQKSE